ncbi:thioesterase family protein [Sporosarcina sp. FSL K6-1522]|uniref:thioesterase family protein n=1 Tax=Sporosarcina sp. FSL K6-1522 TaxID=2921554 RepID=UPI0031599869
MEQTAFNYQTDVAADWVDYNGHMNDAAYALVFSHAVDAFMDYMGLHEAAREAFSYTIFTLETHICYLLEAHKGEQLDVTVQLIDADAKRLHVFFMMKNRAGDLVATSEQMLMGIDTAQGKSAPFPPAIAAFIASIAEADQQLEMPKQVGRSIGIRR